MRYSVRIEATTEGPVDLDAVAEHFADWEDAAPVITLGDDCGLLVTLTLEAPDPPRAAAIACAAASGLVDQRVSFDVVCIEAER